MPRLAARPELSTQSSGGGIQDAFIAVANMLRFIGDAQNAPYLKLVGGISLLILDTVSTIKNNREQAMRMVEHIYQLMCAIINITGVSAGVQLPLQMLRNISQLCDTLQKMHSCIRNLDTILKRIVRYKENSSCLEECNAELNHAMDVFGVRSNVMAALTISAMQTEAKKRHDELIHLLREDDAQGDSTKLQNLRFRSSTLSVMLPATPKIFYGRDSELNDVIGVLLREVPSHVAILGPGGMGKSSLAVAVLHNHQIASKFGPHRYFIACESSSSGSELISLVAVHFGLGEHKKSTQSIIRHLSEFSAPTLLVFDNLETPWESLEFRTKVDEFLSILTDIPQLSLLITMRGAERPGQVRWARPFLPPLSPLSDAAARQTFIDIADDFDSDVHIARLLDFTDNLPLAITLIANLTAFEGYESLVRRLESGTTSLLSEGVDRLSNLDKSISLSLSSPRMVANPDAQGLLGILALLPDGLSEAAMSQIKIPLEIPRGKTTLLRTSLAYVDVGGRLKALMPIREYIRSMYPPGPAIIHPLRNYFFNLVEVYNGLDKSLQNGIIQQISADKGNIRVLIEIALRERCPALHRAVRCVLRVSEFSRQTNLGYHDLLYGLEPIIESLSDVELQGEYLLLYARSASLSSKDESVVLRAIKCFEASQNTTGQAKAQLALSRRHLTSGRINQALEPCKRSLLLAEQAADVFELASAMNLLAEIHRYKGEYRFALSTARRSLVLAQSTGNLMKEAEATVIHGNMCIELGRYEEASSLFTQAKTLCERLGLDSDSTLHRVATSWQAEIHLRKTEYDDARRINSSIMGLGGDLRWLNIPESYARVNVALIDIITSNHLDPSVQENIDGARYCFSKIADFRGLAACDITQASLYARLEQYDKAEDLYLRTLSSIRGKSLDFEACCMEGLYDVSKRLGKLSFHRSFLYFVFAHRIQDVKTIHEAIRRLGETFLETPLEDTSTSLNLFQVALDGFTRMDIHRGKADCFLKIGDILWSRGDTIEARKMWQTARPLFVLTSQVLDITRCDQRLLQWEGISESSLKD